MDKKTITLFFGDCYTRFFKILQGAYHMGKGPIKCDYHQFGLVTDHFWALFGPKK